MHLRIMKWLAKNINNETFENVLGEDGDLQDYSEIYMDASSEEKLREKLLKAPIWDGKNILGSGKTACLAGLVKHVLRMPN